MKKSVGIILDSTSISKQLLDLISYSKTSENYEITALVINNVGRQRSSYLLKAYSYIKYRGIRKLLSAIVFKVVCKIEENILKRINRFGEFYKLFQLDRDDFISIIVNPEISKNGLVYRYADDDINRIRDLNLDLLIRDGGGILRGDILSVCPNGVISFHHADNDINRGVPPGFWEVFYRSPRTGFVIQRLKDELDGGDVLYKGFVATHWFYSLNLAHLYEVSNLAFHHVLDDITSQIPQLKVYEKSPYSYRLYSIPTMLQMTIYLIQTASILTSKVLRRLTGRSYRWGVAYLFSEKWDDAVLWRSKKIPNPKNRFLADPFVVEDNGSHFCFVEDFDYELNKGAISLYRITTSGYEALGKVLEEDYHLSFPFIFTYKNEKFMCPETHEKNEIRLYKATNFPTEWEFYMTIMTDVSAADSIIFEHENRWWLFTNIDQNSVGDHGCQLHIFSSESPLSDEWIAHQNNPVIFDPLVARNAGLILKGDEIYRVFQRQGFDLYGEASGISRITRLSPTEYDEEVCFSIEPNFFKRIKGTHTYNYDSGLIVLDYVEIVKTNTGVE